MPSTSTPTPTPIPTPIEIPTQVTLTKTNTIYNANAHTVPDATVAMPAERFDIIVCRYAVFLYLSWEDGERILRHMVEHNMASHYPHYTLTTLLRLHPCTTLLTTLLSILTKR